jgi:hypothetical protein
MAFNSNVPQPSDVLRNSQNDLLNNFQSLKAAFDTNHVTFDDPDAGKHKFITCPEQSAAPSVAADNIALYSKNSALSGIAELFVKNESGSEYEFTSSSAATPGWTRLPSGILLKWGTSSANGATTITFPTGAAIPAFTSLFTVLLTVSEPLAVIDVDQAITLRIWTITDFDVFASNRSTTGAAPVDFEYLAIGL